MPKRGEFIVADTLPAIEQLVQMGVIELHTWGSRAKKPLSPDRMIFDLDPDPDLPWAAVVNGATLVRTLLNELRLESYVKTTGGKGPARRGAPARGAFLERGQGFFAARRRAPRRDPCRSSSPPR
jgi:hypothetical protein